MLFTQSALKEKSVELAAGIAAARSARNLMTRRRREDAAEEREADRHRRRRERKDKLELEQSLRRRVRVRVLQEEHPRIGATTARKLYHRTVHMLRGTTGLSDARGPDGLYSLHFGFVARGFASTAGRRWRAGEVERAARYIVREDGLEGGEFGWWSNIADDRVELTAFFRAVEAIEGHDRKNANVYCSEIIALPAELTARQRRRAVRRICRFFEQSGLAYVAAIHVPDDAGDQRNFHCHIIYSLRPAERHGTYDWSFGLAKDNVINTPDGIAARRRQVVHDINATLHAAGIDKRYTHLSNKARRMAAAQEKVGQNGIWAARRLAALETRAARLRAIADVASRVREFLTQSANALARMKTAVRERLTDRRDDVSGTMDDARNEFNRYTANMAATLSARRVSVDQTSRSVDDRLARTRRCVRERLSHVAFYDSSARLALLTDVVQAAIGRRQTTIDAARRDADFLVVGARTALARELGAKRRALVVSMIEMHCRLERAGKRTALIDNRRVFDKIAARAALQREALVSARTIVAKRLASMRVAPAGAVSISHRLVYARNALVRNLTDRKAWIVASTVAMDEAVASAKATGQKLVSKGIGKGPGVIQGLERSPVSAPAQHSVASPPQSEIAPTGPTTTTPQLRAVASSRVPQREDQTGRERLRPAADLTLAPPPPPAAETPMHSTSENLRGQSQIALLREQARHREGEALRKLRNAALARLNRLDIAIVTDAAGRHAVVKGGLADDEMRALMDPAYDKETQATLDRIAIARIRQAVASRQAAPGTHGHAGTGGVVAPNSQAASTTEEELRWLRLQRSHLGGGGVGVDE